MTLLDGRHFTVAELACHDGTPYPDEFADRLPTLMALLDAIRDAWGGPLEVVSGYRTPAHNAALIAADEAQDESGAHIGSLSAGTHQVASGSQHVEGRAADLRTSGGPMDVPQLLRVINNLYTDGKLGMLGGVGDYPVSNWVHVDCRPQVPDGHVARWHGR
jgi:uncharacterized protein YcbK (DUF882 family)